MRLTAGLGRARSHLAALRADVGRVAAAARRRGVRRPWITAAGDPSLPALALLRGGAALRAVFGSSLGATQALRFLYHIDVWTDSIGPGLRLPHPFGIVIGDGAEIGANCTIMHNVTIQRGAGTRVGSGAVLATGAIVLRGAQIGEAALVGAASVVRGVVPEGWVAVGAPARPVRPTRAGEAEP